MRTLRIETPLTRGPDVGKLQTLLKRRGYYAGPIDQIYGVATGLAVWRAKDRLGYRTPDHSAAGLLVSYLDGSRKPTAAMVKLAAKRKSQPISKPGQTTTRPTTAPTGREAQIRSACVRIAHLLLAHEPQVHYPPGDVRHRTIHAIATLAELDAEIARGLTIDCSQAVTLIDHVAGAKDPNGAGYRTDGYTGTLLTGSRRISRAQARPGDLVVFGGGTGHHVGMVIEAGQDPLIFSHGQERGPIAIRVSVEARYQPAGITYLRLAA